MKCHIVRILEVMSLNNNNNNNNEDDNALNASKKKVDSKELGKEIEQNLEKALEGIDSDSDYVGNDTTTNSINQMNVEEEEEQQE
jgi:hypothetical protein